jgi:hypothetical protein
MKYKGPTEVVGSGGRVEDGGTMEGRGEDTFSTHLRRSLRHTNAAT